MYSGYGSPREEMAQLARIFTPQDGRSACGGTYLADSIRNLSPAKALMRVRLPCIDGESPVQKHHALPLPFHQIRSGGFSAEIFNFLSKYIFQ